MTRLLLCGHEGAPDPRGRGRADHRRVGRGPAAGRGLRGRRGRTTGRRRSPRPGAVQPDLVVLDVMLPGFDGLEVCRRIQAERPVPVLMLTARDDETDLLVGLAVGADDYLTKPFSLRELAARVHALLRRVERAATGRAGHRSGSATWRSTGPSAGSAGPASRRTSPRPSSTCWCYLAGRPRAVLPRERLLAEVWGWADGAGTRTVDSHVKALRRKLGADLIRTVHGVGYALEVPAMTARRWSGRWRPCCPARSTRSARSRSSSASCWSPPARPALGLLLVRHRLASPSDDLGHRDRASRCSPRRSWPTA